MLAVLAFIFGAIFVVAMLAQAADNGRCGITSRGKILHPNQYDPLGTNRAYVAAYDAALAVGQSRRKARAAGRAAEEARRQYVQKHLPPPTQTQMRRMRRRARGLK